MSRSAETVWSLADCSRVWQKSQHSNWGSLALIAHTHGTAPLASTPLLCSTSLLAPPCSPHSWVQPRSAAHALSFRWQLGPGGAFTVLGGTDSWSDPWRIPTVPSLLRRRKLQLPGGRCYLPSGLVLPLTGLDGCPLCSESLPPGCPSPSIPCIEIRVEIWGYRPWYGRDGKPDFLPRAENNPNNKNASCFSVFSLLHSTTCGDGKSPRTMAVPWRGEDSQPLAGGRKEGCSDDSCLGKAGTAVLQWAGHSRTAWSGARRHQQLCDCVLAEAGGDKGRVEGTSCHLLSTCVSLCSPSSPHLLLWGLQEVHRHPGELCREPHKVPWLMSVPPTLKVCVVK